MYRETPTTVGVATPDVNGVAIGCWALPIVLNCYAGGSGAERRLVVNSTSGKTARSAGVGTFRMATGSADPEEEVSSITARVEDEARPPTVFNSIILDAGKWANCVTRRSFRSLFQLDA